MYYNINEKETLRQCLVVIDKFLQNITDIDGFIERTVFNFIIEDLSQTIDEKIDYLIFIWVRFVKLIIKSYFDNKKEAVFLYDHKNTIISNLEKAIKYYNQEPNKNTELVKKIEEMKEIIEKLEEPFTIFITDTSKNPENTLNSDSNESERSGQFLDQDDLYPPPQ